MKNLKTYRMFESSVELSPEHIEWLDQCTKGTWQLNSQTGEVDVDGDFDCSGQGLIDFKGVRFGVIEGHFNCRNNQLSSLEGGPREVKMSFFGGNNGLTSLKGAPQKVRGSFSCSDNQLTSLEGAPQEVAVFSCSDNQLTSLKGAPQKVSMYFLCSDNQLSSLEGGPQEVGENFVCSGNQLITLEGAPQKVGKDFSCSDNQLTTLEGAPQEVGGDFHCYNNPVSNKTLKSIFSRMEKGKSYLKAVESLWAEIPLEDQALLYLPEFEWVVGDERRKFDALKAYQGFKGMI